MFFSKKLDEEIFAIFFENFETFDLEIAEIQFQIRTWHTRNRHANFVKFC